MLFRNPVARPGLFGDFKDSFGDLSVQAVSGFAEDYGNNGNTVK